MKTLLIAAAALILCAPVFGQTADTDPATTDDVILYLRTTHSHDLMQKTLEVQVQSILQLMREQILKEKGQLPAGYDTRVKKAMDDLTRGLPMDEIIQAMIPGYQKHFTREDMAAMTAFYASPLGQKVLQELPAVMQEGMQAAMPIMSKYLSDWTARTKDDLEPTPKAPPAKSDPPANPAQN
jgi:uncharacterized protein